MPKPKQKSTADVVRSLAKDLQNNAEVDEGARKEIYRTMYKDVRRTIDLAFHLDEIRRAKDYIDALAKFANAAHDVLRLELIPERMEEEGIENVRIEDLGRLGLTADMYVSVKEGQRDSLIKWLEKHRLGDLVQETINSSTLKSFVARRMKEGKEIPSDYLNVTPFTRASITKG